MLKNWRVTRMVAIMLADPEDCAYGLVIWIHVNSQAGDKNNIDLCIGSYNEIECPNLPVVRSLE